MGTTLHRYRRKARDLNPHGLAAARFSKPARQTVSGYPPNRVDPAGVEPALPARQAGVFPLDHRPVVDQWRRWESNPTQGACEAPSPPRYMRPRLVQRSGRGSNPVFRAYQGGVRPQHFQTFELRRPDSNRRGNGI